MGFDDDHFHSVQRLRMRRTGPPILCLSAEVKNEYSYTLFPPLCLHGML